MANKNKNGSGLLMIIFAVLLAILLFKMGTPASEGYITLTDGEGITRRPTTGEIYVMRRLGYLPKNVVTGNFEVKINDSSKLGYIIGPNGFRSPDIKTTYNLPQNVQDAINRAYIARTSGSPVARSDRRTIIQYGQSPSTGTSGYSCPMCQV
jgi:hypothetical protein